MHSFKWHYKIVQVQDAETQPCIPKSYPNLINGISKTNSHHVILVINSNGAENRVKLTAMSANREETTDNNTSSSIEEENHLEVINEVSHESESIKTEEHLTTEQAPKEFASVTGNSPIILSDDIRPINNGKWYENWIVSSKNLISNQIILIYLQAKNSGFP